MTFEYELHEREEKAKLEMVDAMFANPKLTDEDIASISGFPLSKMFVRTASTNLIKQRFPKTSLLPKS